MAIKFLGASVRGVQSSIGWGIGSSSQLTVHLAEDDGDAFQPDRLGIPQVGHPVAFVLGGFSFGGLLQKWQKENSTDGLPLYTAICTDPKEILAGTQVITGGYSGSVGSVKNLINAFGWWESFGFGSSLSNDSGMPYQRIRSAILNIVNTPVFGLYGGPLTFRGFSYSLDLSQVPIPPIYYRIPGPSVSLLDLIAQVCEDGGHDFFVDLEGFTIRVHTVSRFSQPALGTISLLANTNWGGNVVRASNGLETRNELTSSFLIGGAVQTIHIGEDIKSFWGLDIIGVPIVGVPGTFDLFDKAGKLIKSLDTEYMDLNASPIADVIGGTTYACSTLELRLAKASLSAWTSFMATHKPGIAAVIGITSPFRNGQVNPNDITLPPDLLNDDKENVKRLSSAILRDIAVKESRVYEFLKGYADEYLGKKYLVGLPFLLQYTELETLLIRNSYDISDGGYLPDGSSPLGLSLLNEDVFKTQDGRFRAFCRIPTLAADMGSVSPNGTVIENDILFMEVQVDPNITLFGTPHAIVTLPGPVWENAADGIGGIADVAAVFQKPDVPENKLFFKQSAMGAFSAKLTPAPVQPTSFLIPLKSNILTYGPWTAVGNPGKVRVEQDDTLTPWNYGGFTILNLAGSAKVADSVSNEQITETGLIEYEGLPTTGLGAKLDAAGPNITDISIDYGPNGATTTYSFRTFTPPKLGVPARLNAERFRKFGALGQELRRSLRLSLRENLEKLSVIGSAARTAKAFLQYANKVVRKRSPHDMLISYTYPMATGTRLGVASCTSEESLGYLNADDDTDFQRTAAMSLNGVLRPFSAHPSGTSNFPRFASPYSSGSYPSAHTLNPWKEKNDIEFFTWGSGAYEGFHAYRNQVVGESGYARVLGLRSPLVLVGFGYDLYTNPVPLGTGGFHEDTYTDYRLWKAGPMDPLWDQARGVWTCHGSVKGTISGTIKPGESGLLRITTSLQNRASPSGLTLPGSGVHKQYEYGIGTNIEVWNFFSAYLNNGKRAFAQYIPYDNRWYITAVDC
jgi:hypothetical protein